MQTSAPSFPPLEYHDGAAGDSFGNGVYMSHGGFNYDTFVKSRRNTPEHANIILRERNGVPPFSQQDNQQSVQIKWDWVGNMVVDEQQKLFNTRAYGPVDSNSGYHRKGLQSHLANNHSKFSQPVFAHPLNLNKEGSPGLHSQNLTGIPKHDTSYDTQAAWRNTGRGAFFQQFGGIQNAQFQQSQSLQSYPQQSLHPQRQHFLQPPEQQYFQSQQYPPLQSQHQLQEMHRQFVVQEMEHYKQQQLLQQEFHLQVLDTSYSALLHGPDTPPSQPDLTEGLQNDHTLLQGASFVNVPSAGSGWAVNGLPYYHSFAGNAREGNEPLVPLYPEKGNAPQEHFDSGVKEQAGNVPPDAHHSPGETQVQFAPANGAGIGSTQSNELGRKQHITCRSSSQHASEEFMERSKVDNNLHHINAFPRNQQNICDAQYSRGLPNHEQIHETCCQSGEVNNHFLANISNTEGNNLQNIAQQSLKNVDTRAGVGQVSQPLSCDLENSTSNNKYAGCYKQQQMLTEITDPTVKDELQQSGYPVNTQQRATGCGRKSLAFQDTKRKVWISNASQEGSPINGTSFPHMDNKQTGRYNLRHIQQQINTFDLREFATIRMGNTIQHNHKSIDVLRQVTSSRESGGNENGRTNKAGHNQKPSSETDGHLQVAWRTHTTPNVSPDTGGQSSDLNGHGSSCNDEFQHGIPETEVSHQMNLAPNLSKIGPLSDHTQERDCVYGGVAHQPLQNPIIQSHSGNQCSTMVKTLHERAAKLVPDRTTESSCPQECTEPEGPSIKKQRKHLEQVNASPPSISLAHLRRNQGPFSPQNINLGLGPPHNLSQSIQQVCKLSRNKFSGGHGDGQDQDQAQVQAHDHRTPSSNMVRSSPIAQSHCGNDSEVRDGDEYCQRSNSAVLLQTPVASVAVPSPSHMPPYTEDDIRTPIHAVNSFKNFGGAGSLQKECVAGGNQPFHSVQVQGSASGYCYSPNLPSDDYIKQPSSGVSGVGDYSSHSGYPMYNNGNSRQALQDQRMTCVATQPFGETAHVANFSGPLRSSLPGQSRFVPCHERAPSHGIVESFHMPSGGSHAHVIQANLRPQMPTRRFMATAFDCSSSTPGSQYLFEGGNSQAKSQQERFPSADPDPDPSQLVTSNLQSKCREPDVCFSSPVDAAMANSFRVWEENEDQAKSRQSIQYSYSKPSIPVPNQSGVVHGDTRNISGTIDQLCESEFASLGHTLPQIQPLDDYVSVSAGIEVAKSKDLTFINAQVAASVSAPYLGSSSNKHLPALQMTSYHSFNAVSRALPDSQERLENGLGWRVSYAGQMHDMHGGMGKSVLRDGASGILHRSANFTLDQISRHHLTKSKKLFHSPAICHIKKRKKPVSLLVPWHVAASQPRGQLPSISEADMMWANATNRLTDKDDGGIWYEGTSSAVRAKRRLKITTRLMQQLVQPLPRKLIHENTLVDRECATYYVAKLALGEACRIVAGVAREAEVTIDSKNMEVVRTKAATTASTTQAAITKLVERLMDNVRRLDGEIARLECSIFVSDLKIETQNLERLSIVNRWTKHHPTSFFLDSSSQKVFFDSVTVLGPEKYATAVPLPRTLPEVGRCLSL